ncbi:RusA family crossover junction endodeoxyribonuclease [Gimesia chilikensis]|uniref:RusA family crossover junction endodeoxyribonuclease n=1 Tax=Gimesia chilikensis TaxID=2605989 RepID=UPI00118A191E|nr:RusA family crossover junction endodeoxyribonuclease [Gimesia chilikensis]QDT86392.1 hypothetical protein MalM14_40680 [Gimesia chilikensis]
MNHFLPYDPGEIPHLPAPIAGTSIDFGVVDYPPIKDTSFSIRNPKHKNYMRFVNLRLAAIDAMGGHAWSHGPVKLDLEVYAPSLEPERSLLDYLGGVLDTLDGSHGSHFHYLPAVYNDDCQVCDCNTSFHISEKIGYEVKITFL